MDGWINQERLSTLPRKSMKIKKRLKKASETGKMTVKAFMSLIIHCGVFEQVCKSV